MWRPAPTPSGSATYGKLRREQVVAYFSSADDMRGLLVQGLSKLKENVAPPASSIHYVRELTSPPEPYVAHPYTLLQTFSYATAECELGTMALNGGDLEQAQRYADNAGRTAARTGQVDIEIQVAALRGAIALRRGDLQAADEHLHPALVHAREAGLADGEVGILILLADRHFQGGDVEAARRHLANADHLIDRGLLRLRKADSLNLRSRIEHTSGDDAAAATAAADAWRAAWCDGPPFAYAEGLRQARENLAVVGAPEPTDLEWSAAPPPMAIALTPLAIQDVIDLALAPGDTLAVQFAIRALVRRGQQDDLAALHTVVRSGSDETRLLALNVVTNAENGESPWLDSARGLLERTVWGDRSSPEPS